MIHSHTQFGVQQTKQEELDLLYENFLLSGVTDFLSSHFTKVFSTLLVVVPAVKCNV